MPEAKGYGGRPPSGTENHLSLRRHIYAYTGPRGFLPKKRLIKNDKGLERRFKILWLSHILVGGSRQRRLWGVRVRL